jgi:tRNA nucleotidyltransferase/poly(A) polymerase
MRAARIAAKLNFSIEERTLAGMEKCGKPE